MYTFITMDVQYAPSKGDTFPCFALVFILLLICFLKTCLELESTSSKFQHFSSIKNQILSIPSQNGLWKTHKTFVLVHIDMQKFWIKKKNQFFFFGCKPWIKTKFSSSHSIRHPIFWGLVGWGCGWVIETPYEVMKREKLGIKFFGGPCF
jgi:hypothetical protein